MLVGEVDLAYHTLLKETALRFALGNPCASESGIKAALSEVGARGRKVRKCLRDGGGHADWDGNGSEGFRETGQRAHGGGSGEEKRGSMDADQRLKTERKGSWSGGGA